MYGAETWVLSKADELRLGVFERKILRIIYGPVCEGAAWRARYNEELYHLYDETDLVTTIRVTRDETDLVTTIRITRDETDLLTTIRITRLRWAGQMVRKQDNLPCKKITSDKPEGRRRVG